MELVSNCFIFCDIMCHVFKITYPFPPLPYRYLNHVCAGVLPGDLVPIEGSDMTTGSEALSSSSSTFNSNTGGISTSGGSANNNNNNNNNSSSLLRSTASGAQLMGGAGGPGGMSSRGGPPPAYSSSKGLISTGTGGVNNNNNNTNTNANPDLRSHEGYVLTSAIDGLGFESRLAVLDPASRLLIFFDSPSRGAGTERAALDMLGAVVHREPPPGAPAGSGAGPMFWLSHEDSGIYGQTKGGRPTHATAIQCKTEAERDEWLAVLDAAADHSNMIGGEPIPPSPTMLHVMKGATLFSPLRSASERRIELHVAERNVLVYADAKGGQLATVLKLDMPGTRIQFASDLPGERPTKGWSSLRLEIYAPSSLDTEKFSLHTFRTRDYKEFCGWAAALASL